MSSYQIDLTPSLKVTVGIMLNVTPDHLDRHGTIENLRAHQDARAGERDIPDCRRRRRFRARDGRGRDRSVRPQGDRGFRRARSCRTAISRGRPISIACPARTPKRSPTSPASVRCAACTMRRMRSRPSPPVPRSGSTTIRSAPGCSSFPGLAHRMEEVGGSGKVLFVNDSKATNADSTDKALASFDDIFWIAGGRPKAGGITTLSRVLPENPQGLSDRRGGRGLCAARLTAGAYEMAGTLDRRCRRRGARRGGIVAPERCCAALAGLRFVRPVPEFRGAGQCVPRSGEGAGLTLPTASRMLGEAAAIR